MYANCVNLRGLTNDERNNKFGNPDLLKTYKDLLSVIGFHCISLIVIKGNNKFGIPDLSLT